MKKKTKNITTILIATIAAILCAAILITVIYHHDWFASPISSTSMIVSEITETIVVDQTAPEATPSTESTPQETSSQPTSSVVSAQPSAQPSSNPQTSSNNSGGLSFSGTGENKVRHPISGLPFKQPADPETGISWDGISPITYTYSNGTTGTEKRDGATYEYVPGMVATYKIPRDSAGREIGTICPMCQKEIQYLSKGIYCTQTKYRKYCGECGVYLQPYTCHTCAVTSNNFFCEECGKIQGDGNNGSCVRWLMGDVDCPNCGKYVKVYTCHTCDE